MSKMIMDAHQEIVLDFPDDICYTEDKSLAMCGFCLSKAGQT